MFWTAFVAVVSAVFGFMLKKWKRDDAREERMLERAEKGPMKELRKCHEDKLALTEKLARSQERELNLREDLDHLKEHEHAANVECDTSGRITDWDATAVRMFGWTKEQAVGQNVEIIVPRAKRGRHGSAFAASVAGHGIVKPDGASRVLTDKALTRGGNEIGVKITLTSYIRDGETRFQARIVHYAVGE